MKERKVVIFGGSGFIGTSLTDHLTKNGYEVVIADIEPPKNRHIKYVECDAFESIPKHDLLRESQIVINVLGSSIIGRWTNKFKQMMYDSRIETTRRIVESFEDLDFRPDVFISASATGFYGDRADEELSEKANAGTGLLARICDDWEEEALKASRYGLRSVVMRQGTVIGRDGGFLKAQTPLRKWRIYPEVEEQNGWFPWVHIHDLVSAYEKVITSPDINGPVNVVSPEHIRKHDATKLFKQKVNPRFSIKIPEWILDPSIKSAKRELSFSQKVVPSVLIQHDFTWVEKDLRNALNREIPTLS